MKELKAVEILSRQRRLNTMKMLNARTEKTKDKYFKRFLELDEALSELAELTQEKSCENCAIAYICKTFQTLKNANVLIGDENLVCSYYTPKG